jgi:hypothetical protein
MSRLRPRIQQKLDGLVARVEQLLAQSADPGGARASRSAGRAAA